MHYVDRLCCVLLILHFSQIAVLSHTASILGSEDDPVICAPADATEELCAARTDIGCAWDPEQARCVFADVKYMTNGGNDFEAVIRFLHTADMVYTSSYHATWWSILLGKPVVYEWNTHVLLTKMVNFPYRYVTGTGDLGADFEAARVSTHPDSLARCRQANLLFYERALNLILDSKEAAEDGDTHNPGTEHAQAIQPQEECRTRRLKRVARRRRRRLLAAVRAKQSNFTETE